MPGDLQDTIREIVTRAASGSGKKDSSGGLSSVKGLAAGAGAAMLVPLAAKGIGKVVSGAAPDGLSDFMEKLGGSGDDSGGPGGLVKDALKSALPGGGGGDGGGSGGGSKDTVPGVGKGRRMPVQQAVDIGAPIETVYNQFTQFELWPNFMHRVTDVSQEDQCKISISTKIWGKKKEFVARIETQRPDERLKWKVEEGLSHTGVVTFHELGPRLTRVLVGLDVEPGGMLEKAARGLRHIKRAVRADLHRFKAFIEIQEVETGAWRGVIENGKVVEEHDSSYDKSREYSKFEDVFKGPRSKKPTPSESGSSSGSSKQRSSSSGRSSKQSSSSSGRSSGSSSRSRGSRNGGSSSSRGRSRSSNHSGSTSRSRRSN